MISEVDFEIDMLNEMSNYSLICLWFIEAKRLMRINDCIKKRKKALAFMRRFVKEGFKT